MKLHINPDLLQKSTEQTSNLLIVPDDAAHGRNNTRRWAEIVTVSGVNMEDADKGRTSVEVKFRVSMTSPNAANRGKATRARFLLNPNASEGSGDYTMTMISLSNIQQLLKSAFPDLDLSTGLDMDTFFGQSSPLLGMDVVATVVDKPDRDDPTVRRQELQRFTHLG